MNNWIATQFWKFVKYRINQGYGYCDGRDGERFLSPGRCPACDASDVCDWISTHIILINDL